MRAVAPLAATLLLFSCERGPTEPGLEDFTRPPTEVVATTMPGVHFLAPLSASASAPASLDGSQSPDVVVCVLTDSPREGCGEVVASFTTGGAGAAGVRYDASNQWYEASWNTGAAALDLAKTYRVSVSLGAAELGYVDVKLVAAKADLSTVPSALAAIVAGQTLPIRFRIEQGTVKVIAPGQPATVGPTGGAVASADGKVALSFPDGALASPTPITIVPADPTLPGVPTWTAAVDLGPDGSTFSEPVTLTLTVDPAQVPAGVPPEALAIFTFEEGGWVEVPGSTFSSTSNSVSAQIEHFSVYVAGVFPNRLTPHPERVTIETGRSGSFAGVRAQYRSIPGQRICYTGSGCKTETETRVYDLPGRIIRWESLDPSVLEFIGSSASRTGVDGVAPAPPARAISPGVKILRARTTSPVSHRRDAMIQVTVVPSAAYLAGTYNPTKITVIQDGERFDILAGGGKLQLVLAADGKTSGYFTVPPVPGEEGSGLNANLAGTFSLQDSELTLDTTQSTPLDGFVFTIDGQTLSGSGVIGNEDPYGLELTLVKQ